MRIKNSDLIAAILIAMINIVWTQIPDRPLVVSVIFALPVIFILPGYSLTQGLMSKRFSVQAIDTQSSMPQSDRKKGQLVDGSDQLVLSLGLSLAVDVLVGYTLNMFPPGLQAQSWVLSLGLFTILCALLAVFLRRKNSVQISGMRGPRITISQGVLVGLAILITTTAIWFALIRPGEPPSSFTQLWMIPANQANKSCAVSIGVQNFEVTPLTYRVVVLVNGAQTNTWSSIVLTPRKEWVQSVLLIPKLAHSMFIEAQLYRVDKPDTVYRTVHLTFYIAEGGKNRQIQQCTLS